MVPQPLFLSRPLTNAGELIAWAKSVGFTTTQLPEDMHVTIAFSKDPIEWPTPHNNNIEVPPGPRQIEALGAGDAVALTFYDPTLDARWHELQNLGASWSYDGYRPHVTITWNAPPDLDLDAIVPFDGPLLFGPEEAKPLNEDWQNDHVEKVAMEKAGNEDEARDDHGRWSAGGGGGGKGRASGGGTPKGIPDLKERGFKHQRKRDTNGGLTEFWQHKDGTTYRVSYAQLGGEKGLRIQLENGPIRKAGARHSAADSKMIQDAHDTICKLGAKCSTEKMTDAEREELAEAQVAKVDDALGLVFGFAIISKIDGEDYYDVQGDNIPEESMLKAATEYMLDSRVAKEMHAGDDIGKIVFAFPLTTDIAKAFGLTTKRTGLLIGMKPDKDSTLAKFRDGTYTGFSIGGRRVIDKEIAA